MMEKVKLREIIPEGESGDLIIKHFSVSEKEAGFANINLKHGNDTMIPGDYIRLQRKNDGFRRVIMSDTPMERRTNWRIIHTANGNVLIAGLGLGMVLLEIAQKPEVEKITVIEISEDVINLVWKHMPDFVKAKTELIHADIMEWEPPKGVKWDVIYFDIWDNVCLDNYDEMKTLHRRYGRRINRDNHQAWIDSWSRDRLKDLSRNGRW